MKHVTDLLANLSKTVKTNAPEILAALGVSGVLTTSYLAHKAAVEVSHDEDAPAGLSNKEKAQRYWRVYIPVVVSGTLTVVCIIGSTKANGKRTAAAVTAYSLTERAFAEYKEKVVEQIGSGKEQKIRDEVAQDRVTRHEGSKEVIVLGGGDVLCCELYTHRFFRSDMETLRKAMNDFNQVVVNQIYVSLDEFYDIVGLDYTSMSSHVGWEASKLMELRFSTVFGPKQEPCLAFDYDPAPKPLHT